MTLPVVPVSCVGLFEAVLCSRSTSGAGTYTHAITPSDTLPYSTFYFAQPGGNYWSVADTKLGAASLSWSPGAPLELSISGSGTTVTRAAAKWATATLVEAVEPFYQMNGATMKFAASGDT